MFTPELIFGNALDYFLLYSNILISFSFHRSTLHWCHWLPGRSVCRLHCTTILKSDSFRLNFHPTPPLVPLISQFKTITWFVVVLPCSVLIFESWRRNNRILRFPQSASANHEIYIWNQRFILQTIFTIMKCQQWPMLFNALNVRSCW